MKTASKKSTTGSSKQEEKAAASASPSSPKRKTNNVPPSLIKPLVFTPARGAVSSAIKKKKKGKCLNHEISFYAMNLHEDAHAVAVVVSGEGNVSRGSWMQKILDDMVRRGGDLYPIPFFEGTFYLCGEDGDRLLNDEG